MVTHTTDSEKSPIVIFACKVFQTIIASLLSPNLADITYLDYGLHVVPKKLTEEIQQGIDRLINPSLIFLGYGLCGNGLVGLNSGVHTLIIPKTDDCIAILLGSYDEYLNEFSKEPGTYYLTKGWLEAGSNPLQEYVNHIDKYGIEKADLIMDMQYKNYSRLMFLAHNEKDFIQYRDQVNEIADFCKRWNMRFEEKMGSDRYIQKMVDLIDRYHSNGCKVFDDFANDEFVIIKPHNIIDQAIFLRSL